MCGRYTLRRINLAHADFDATPSLPFEEFTERPRFNLAPSQDVAVVRLNARGERVLGLVQWGLIPSWTRGKPKVQPINARGETVATSGMFRDALARRRCLVPADGFYEWRAIDEKRKEPTFIHRLDDAPFAFAGLWERWRPDGADDPVDTVTIITTTANALMAPIHARMPVILDRTDHARWLDRTLGSDAVSDLIRPAATDGWETYPVSTAVNSPRNDGPELLARVPPIEFGTA